MIKDYNLVDWKDIVYYDGSSPTGLRWKSERRNGWNNSRVLINADDSAGRISSGGYATLRFDGKEYRTHRIIWILYNGSIDNEKIIDHIDGDKLNNKISNLRLVSNCENSRNCGARKNNTSGFVGVHYSEKYDSFVANWFDIENNRKSKSFSIKKYGLDAFEIACKYRITMVGELNKLGAGYTDKHIYGQTHSNIQSE